MSDRSLDCVDTGTSSTDWRQQSWGRLAPRPVSSPDLRQRNGCPLVSQKATG